MLMDDRAEPSGLIVPNQSLTLPSTAGTMTYSDDFDIKKLMDEAVDPLTGMMRDLRVDDRDLPLAKNFFEFSTEFSKSNPPWARQMLIMTILFGEFCPRCSDKKWLRLENVDPSFPTRELPERIQFLNYGKCPKCKATKLELYKSGEINLYKELVLVWGQRSGKSVTGMAGAGYLAHRWLKYPRISTIAPEQVQNFTPLSATFVALTFSRAVSLLWAPFMNLINNTPWFDEYHKMLDHYGEKYGVPLYRKKEIFIKYFHKNLHFYPMHPNASVLRGDTRIFGAIDELGMFPMEKRKNTDEADTVSERANAREALLSLDNSLATMFAVTMSLIKKGYHHTPPVMLMGLSSPKHLRDMVMQRFRASQKGEMSRLMLGSQMATWDINPFLGRNSEYIRGKFDDDPIAAQRDLGAQPPRIAHTFIHRNQILGRKWPFTGAPNALKLNYEFGDLEDAEDMWARLMNGHTGKLPHPSVMSLDAGMVDNSFSVASTHYDQKTGKYIASVILEVIPQHGRTINFNRLYKELLLPFARATSAQIVVADRWQSVDILHRFKDDIPGIAVKQKSLRRYEFDEAMHIIKNGNYVLPFLDQNSKEVQKILDSGGEGVQDYRTEMVNRPIHHLLWQMLTLQDVGPTACPEKGEDCTDDNFRAAFLGLIAITQPQVADILIKHPVKYVDQESNAQLVSLFISRGGARLM